MFGFGFGRTATTTQSSLTQINSSTVKKAPAILDDKYKEALTWVNEGIKVPNSVINAELPGDKDATKAMVKDGMSEFVNKHLNMIYGTTVSSVLAAYYQGLIIARHRQDASNLLMDMALAVFVSQTVSRSWTEFYEANSNNSIFKAFEIDGRKGTSAGSADSWTSTSSMNATAVGILGQLIMECAPEGTSLKKKAQTDGTIFSPVEGESEYQKITKEASKNVSKAEKELLTVFAEQSEILLAVIADLFEAGSGDVGKTQEIAVQIGIKTF